MTTTAFSMLNASRRLENYLSREYYNLNKMLDNARVSPSLFKTKVDQYNELVDTLNELFGSLTNSEQPLFKRYAVSGADTAPPTASRPVSASPSTRSSKESAIIDVNVIEELSVMQEPEHVSPVVKSESSKLITESAATEPIPDTIIESEAVTEANEQDEQDEQDEASDLQDTPESNEDEPSTPIWQLEGYTSYEEWCADKEVESAEIRDDVSVGVNAYLSQYRAGKALSDYQESSEQDITVYNPEDDKPVSVLPHVQEKPTRSTEDLRYLNHTVDGTRVDEDPTQIAKVQTAVEQDYENAGKGADIDVSSFIYQSESVMIDNLIDDDISKLQASRDTK